MPRQRGGKKKPPTPPDVFQAGQMRFDQAIANSNRYNRENPDASPLQKNANAFLQGFMVPTLALKDSKTISRTGKVLGKAGVPFAKEIGGLADVLGFGQRGGRRIKL